MTLVRALVLLFEDLPCSKRGALEKGFNAAQASSSGSCSISLPRSFKEEISAGRGRRLREGRRVDLDRPLRRGQDHLPGSAGNQETAERHEREASVISVKRTAAKRRRAR